MALYCTNAFIIVIDFERGRVDHRFTLRPDFTVSLKMTRITEIGAGQLYPLPSRLVGRSGHPTEFQN